jgi:hypothetical protein
LDLRFSQRWLRKVTSSGIKRHVLRWKSTDVLNEFVVSIFTVAIRARSACLAYHSTLTMEVTCSCEMSVDFQRTTRRYIPEYRTLQVRRVLDQEEDDCLWISDAVLRFVAAELALSLSNFQTIDDRWWLALGVISVGCSIIRDR